METSHDPVRPLIPRRQCLRRHAGGCGHLFRQAAVQPEASRIIARDISWICGPAACQGNTAESRPAVLCQGLAKRAGQLTSFVADGRAFGAAELAKCNLSAKRGAASASAQGAAN